MPRGYKTGGRKPITPAGAAVLLVTRIPRELKADLQAMARANGEPVSEIVRSGVAAKVARWKKSLSRSRGGGSPAGGA